MTIIAPGIVCLFRATVCVLLSSLVLKERWPFLKMSTSLTKTNAFTCPGEATHPIFRTNAIIWNTHNSLETSKTIN